MKVIFMGTPDFAVPALEAVAKNHQIVAVYCQPPRPAGRGQKDRPSPVQARAEALGLKVFHPKSLKSVEEQEAFRALGADIAVVVAYGLILPKPILDAPAKGCVNIHASLLPRWRGAAPIHRAIIAGDYETGICIMQMDEGLDTGPVLMRQTTPISRADTTADLHDRLAVMGGEMIVQALAQIDDLVAEPQPLTDVTYAAKIDKAEARIDWSRTATDVARLIRGLSPFPGAWCEVGGERIKLLRATAVAGSDDAGTVLRGFTVACGEGAVEITQAQRPGKRPMDATELLRGLTLPHKLE